jgi:hypothetical protein
LRGSSTGKVRIGGDSVEVVGGGATVIAASRDGGVLTSGEGSAIRGSESGATATTVTGRLIGGADVAVTIARGTGLGGRASLVLAMILGGFTFVASTAMRGGAVVGWSELVNCGAVVFVFGGVVAWD